MDRLFVVSSAALADPDGVDTRILHEELKKTAARDLDWVVTDEQEVPERAKKLARVAIPVGGIEFVRERLRRAGAKDAEMTPLEIPEPLRGMAGREYFVAKGSEIAGTEYTDADRYFVKDASRLKSWTSLPHDGDVSRMIDPGRAYVVSEKIDLLSEYRCFVHMDEVKAVQRYAGHPLVFPDPATISEMVARMAASERPDAYVLDVAVKRAADATTSTVPIEAHPFVSCGLYGYVPDAVGDELEAGYRWYLEGGARRRG